MSLATRLKKIYTEGDQYTVLQLLHALIKEIENYEEEQGNKLYEHCVRMTNTVSSEVLVSIINNSNEKITAQEVLAHFTSEGGVAIMCTGVDDNDRPIYGAYTENNDLTLVGKYGQEYFEQTFTIDDIKDFIKEIN